VNRLAFFQPLGAEKDPHIKSTLILHHKKLGLYGKAEAIWQQG